MNTSPCYELRDMKKQVSSQFQLDLEQLAIPRQQVLAVIGPTGAGKSTFLKLLAGLEPITSGSILFEEKLFDSQRLALETQRRITLVHQRPMLLTGSVQMNIEYGLRLRNTMKDLMQQQVQTVMAQLELQPLANQSAQTLSGGQSQLVALARALVLQPDVLLLDEPTANLDRARVELVERVVRDTFQERPMTIIWATHNLFQARRVSQQVTFLLDGKLVEVTKTETFFDSPQDPRSVDFVEGRMVY